MLNGFRNFFLAPTIKDAPEKEQDIRTTHRVALILLLLAPLSIFFMFRLETPIRYYAIGGTIGGAFIWLFTIYMIKQGQIFQAKIIIITINTVNLLLVIYFIGNMQRPTIFATLFLLALVILLFPRRGALIYGAILLVLSTALFILGRISQTPDPTFPLNDRSIFSIYLFTLIATSILLEIVSANMRTNLENSLQTQQQLQQRNFELDKLSGQLEKRVEERASQLEKRANQLEAISNVARSTASLQNMDELLPVIAKVISNSFGFYHVGIFLVDENKENAILRAANSEGGRAMQARHHQLPMDANSIVGYATSRQEPRIALDVGTDAVFFNNPDLPDTRSEMAIPLLIGNNVIGALDVQSTEPNAFTEEDVATLSTLADQVAIAIENSRLFSESRAALKESEETFARYVKREWSSFSAQAKHTGYFFDGKRTMPAEAKDKAQKARALPQTGRLSLEKGIKELSVPIRLRGQVIGYLDIKPKNDQRKWTQDDVTLLEAAAERAALALENARLVEAAQRRASREQTIGEISSKIGAVSDLDVIMQTAVEELGRKIGNVMEVSFELDTQE